MSNSAGQVNGHHRVNGHNGSGARNESVLSATFKAARHVTPTGREVMFGVEETLVSKTDLTGKITYANDVFFRVAGYSEAEVIGQPHSFIRHPDMPRAVFKLLWETIQSGREIFAYVVNLAANGDHYWVFAHVTPSFDENNNIVGYHSNRRYADRLQIEKIQALYGRLLAAERGQGSKSEAVAASTKLLHQVIAEAHRSYEEFIFSI
jgi:PAS domain S-box-containing protein